MLTLTACGGEVKEPTADDPAAADYRGPKLDPGIVNVTEQIKQDPKNGALYAARAEMWFDKNNFDNAITDLQSALVLDSTNLDYHYLLSEVYLDYFQSRLALRTIQRAVALEPENVESLLYQAEIQLILKLHDEALASLNEVVRIAPREPEAYLLLGKVFAETQDTARAINATQEAVEIDPEIVDAWIYLGQLHAAIKSPLAGRYFDTAISVDPNDVVAIHAKADYLRDQDQLNEAIALYRKTGEIDQQYVDGHYNAGLLLLEQDSVEAAQRELNIVIGNNPLHIQGYFFRGYTHELQCNIAAARKDYETALRFSPDYQLALDGMARISE
ncbi:MAG: tetratricopeptide repeat protein [Bacteroidota bacterium]